MKIYIPNCSLRSSGFVTASTLPKKSKSKLQLTVEVAVSSYRLRIDHSQLERWPAFDDAIFQVENSDRAEATEAAI